MAQYSIAIRQATLVGFAGPVPFQGQGLACEAGKGIVLRHVRYNFVVSGQGRGGLPGGMAIACIRIVHVFVQKIPHIVLSGGNATVQFFGGGFRVGHRPVKISSSSHNFPNQRLSGRIGVIYCTYAKLLGSSGRKAVYRYQHEQVLLGSTQLVLPIWAGHQVPMPGRIHIEFSVACAVVCPFVYAVKVRFAVVLRGILAPVHLQDVDGIALEPIQAVVVMVAPVATVAGGTVFPRLPAGVECPHARYCDLVGVAVLIAGSKYWQDERTKQNKC